MFSRRTKRPPLAFLGGQRGRFFLRFARFSKYTKSLFREGLCEFVLLNVTLKFSLFALKKKNRTSHVTKNAIDHSALSLRAAVGGGR